MPIERNISVSRKVCFSYYFSRKRRVIGQTRQQFNAKAIHTFLDTLDTYIVEGTCATLSEISDMWPNLCTSDAENILFLQSGIKKKVRY